MEHRTEHAKKKKEKRKGAQPTDSIPTCLGHCAIGAAVSLLLAILLTPVGGAVCFAMADPVAPTVAAGLIIRLLCAIAGGFVAARKNKGKLLLSGGVCGLMLVLLYALLSLAFSPETRPFSLALSRLLRAAVIPMAIIGAMLGGKRRPVGRHRHR